MLKVITIHTESLVMTRGLNLFVTVSHHMLNHMVDATANITGERRKGNGINAKPMMATKETFLVDL